MASDGSPAQSSRSVVLAIRPEYERIGLWLKELREKQNVGQRELCRRLGKPPAFIHKVEHGKQRIDLVEFLDLLQAIGTVQDVSMADLVNAAKPKAQ